MDRGDGLADSGVGKRPNPTLAGPKRFRPSPDAADNQDIDQAGDHERGPRLPGRVFNDQELGNITDQHCGLIGFPGDVNTVRQKPQQRRNPRFVFESLRGARPSTEM